MISGQTLVAGEPAILIAAPTAPITPFGALPTTCTIDSDTFSPIPLAFPVHGTTLSADGPSVIGDATLVSSGT